MPVSRFGVRKDRWLAPLSLLGPDLTRPHETSRADAQSNGLASNNRGFPIYQTMLGYKTCKYYYETDELIRDPRPTQPKKKSGQKWRLGHFFPQQNTFSWVRTDFITWETDYKKPNPTKLCANTLSTIICETHIGCKDKMVA